MLLVIAILLVLVLIGIARCIVIVPQSNAYVTEWLGVYKDTWGAGLHLRTPFVERVSRKVSLKEEAADFPPQPVITRDNVTMISIPLCSSRCLMPSCLLTVSTAPSRPSRTFLLPRCAISSVLCPWTKR